MTTAPASDLTFSHMRFVREPLEAPLPFRACATTLPERGAVERFFATRGRMNVVRAASEGSALRDAQIPRYARNDKNKGRTASQCALRTDGGEPSTSCAC